MDSFLLCVRWIGYLENCLRDLAVVCITSCVLSLFHQPIDTKFGMGYRYQVPELVFQFLPKRCCSRAFLAHSKKCRSRNPIQRTNIQSSGPVFRPFFKYPIQRTFLKLLFVFQCFTCIMVPIDTIFDMGYLSQVFNIVFQLGSKRRLKGYFSKVL